MKVICQQFGDDLFQIFRKITGLLHDLENLLKGNGYEFMCSDHYGYLTSRPQELGTSLRVSVNVKLPLIAKVRRLYSENSDDRKSMDDQKIMQDPFIQRQGSCCFFTLQVKETHTHSS